MANVASQHPFYRQFSSRWRRCRDATGGEDAVKGAAELYLPRLSGQNNDEYGAYLIRALFYGATGRTVESLVGAVTRKPAQIAFPGGDASQSYLNDFGLGGESLDLIASQILEEVITVGRVGVLVDAPEQAGGNPYVAIYYVENIINWREQILTDSEGNVRKRLTLVVLQEDALVEDPSDVYNVIPEERYRVLSLDGADEEDPGSGTYTVRLYRKAESSSVDGKGRNGADDVESAEYELISESNPTFAGGAVPHFIPFTFVTPSGVSSTIQRPPILALVNVNLSHYRTSADLEHGLHYTALPTAWVAGFDVKQSQLRIGSATAWVTENPGAHAGFLEFSGAGLGALTTSMKNKEQQMAVLGARLLEEQSPVGEAAAAIALRQAGERSVLSNIANATSEGVTIVLRWFAEWSGLADAEDASYTFNQDFGLNATNPAVMNNLFLALQQGKFSYVAWFNYLQKSDFYPDNWTLEQETQALAEGSPETPPPPGGDPAQSDPAAGPGQDGGS